ncbi:hypothetical protein TrRE_jg2920 [Triparma retinervis]|uniref:Uncharacterized protein n=1 Tax=Triparma retinervis TaxID=2557542 RepID=A0A9W7FYF6_9STRA|nr:hypothetical protein TrRE_jg2920 [Triparma retinervis]
MKEDVGSRPLVDTIKLVSRRSIKASDKEEDNEVEGNGTKAADEEEIRRLRVSLESNEEGMEENRVKFMAKEKEVQERDEQIQERDEKIARLEERIARFEERGG